MDKYHIYEEIGKGEFSQVFKGREKKKIEYVAIKRIEKSVMTKTVNEVQVMHKLNSVHMLKFHDWYETRNNLWLILEYCTGADLEALIKQDGHLPETSVRIFGLDILAAVKYIHSIGMIHGDIRPCNFLVDEYGILKLSDFKYTRKIPKESLGDTPIPTRGTPCYMSPELFTSDGVHSFQSDFWAIGCILYQMRRGTLPFGDHTLKLSNLIHNINHIEPVNAPLPVTLPEGNHMSNKALMHPSVTADLADILLWLLEKSPVYRCTWENLSAHPFWAPNNPAVPSPMPAQPAFELYCRDEQHSHAQALESSSIAEYGVRLDGSLDFSSLTLTDTASAAAPVLVTGTTPLKLPQSVDSTPIRSVPTTTTTTTTATTATEKARIHTTNKAGDARTDATEALSTPPATAQPGGISAVALSNQITPERHNSAAQQAAYALSQQQSQSQGMSIAGNHTPTTAGILEHQQHSRQQHQPSQHSPTVVQPTHNQSVLNNDALPATDAAFQRITTTDTKQLNTAGITQKDDSLAAFTVDSLLLHSSDTQVKSIAGNKLIEINEKISYKNDTLPFPTPTVDIVINMNITELETHLSNIYKLLQKTLISSQTTIPTIAASNALYDRLNSLGYLYNISTCAEVANVVLNTHFLGLLLKIIKTQIVYSTSTPGSRTHTTSSNSNSTVSTMVNAMNNNAQQGRYLSATILALLLRYVSNLQPPTIRAREDHIVPSIITLLRDSNKIDVKLKRRCVAALGEMIFYISAQLDDEGIGSNNTVDRWLLPVAAVDTLVECIKEEDEIVKHYAIKTIENVFAQGALEFRRKFVSIDLAVRLLELSQSSKNEHLQASCGMAVAHMLYLVITAHHYPSIIISSTTNTPGGVATGRNNINSRTGNNLNHTTSTTSTTTTTTTLNDIFTQPNPLKGVKFFSKVLEKGGLPGIIEVLRDGPAKLQQAYLSIINLVFTIPLQLPNNISNEMIEYMNNKSNIQAINVTLRMSRNFFLKSPTLLPLIMNLVEQGGMSAIRGKALLTIQLLCSTSPTILASLSERRLPNILIRALSPVITAQETDSNKPLSSLSLNYYSKTALSMLLYLRSTCFISIIRLTEQLNRIVETPSCILQTDNPAYTYDSPSKTTSAGYLNSGRKTNTTSPYTKHGTPRDRDLGNTSPISTTSTTSSIFNLPVLQNSASVLSAVAAVASQPALRRLILASNGEILVRFAETLTILPTSRAALQQLLTTTTQQLNKHTSTPNASDSIAILNNVETSLQTVEHACLIMLEMLSQSEFIDNSTSTIQFLEATLRYLIPAAAQSLHHSSGDTRVVVTSALRRLLPITLLSATQLSESSKEYNYLLTLGIQCVSVVLSHSTILLVDQAPIPQYFIRLLLELRSISSVIARVVVDTLVKYNTVECLLKLLRPHNNSSSSNIVRDEEQYETADSSPQLALLLRGIFETGDYAELLLKSDMATILTAAAISNVCGNINEALIQGLQGQHAEFFNISLLPSHEGTIVLIDLIQVVLYYVMRSQPREPQNINTIAVTHADTLRRQVACMRAISPVLLMLISYTSTFLQLHTDNTTTIQYNPRTDESNSPNSTAITAYSHLLDTSTKCMALLFDLFPDSLTTQLLSKQSILLETNSQQQDKTSGRGLMSPNRAAQRGSQLTPRIVLAEALLNPQIEIKVRFRLLKVLTGVCRMAASMNISAQVKELLTTAPLLPALISCSSAAEVATNMRTMNGKDLHVDEIHMFVRTAGQLCELGSHL